MPRHDDVLRLSDSLSRARRRGCEMEGSPEELLGKQRVLLPAETPLPEGYVRTNLFTTLRDRKNSDALFKLGITSACMAVLPLSGFFYSRHVFLPQIGVHSQVDLISALVAVFIAQVIIAVYVVIAMRESTDDAVEEEEIVNQVKQKELIMMHPVMKKARKIYDTSSSAKQKKTN